LPLRFRIVAVGFAIGAVVHATEAVASVFGHSIRDYALWRHGLFIVIDGGLAALAITGPRLLWAPLLLLLAQQSTTHGRDVVRTWRANHSVAWLSVVTMTFVIASAMLATAYRGRARAGPRVRR